MLRLTALRAASRMLTGADRDWTDIGSRVFEAVADAGLGGEVDDHSGSPVCGRLVERRLVLQHADDRREAVRLARIAWRRSFSATS